MSSIGEITAFALMFPPKMQDKKYLNGGYVKLKDAGVAQQNQPAQTRSKEPNSDNRLMQNRQKNARK